MKTLVLLAAILGILAGAAGGPAPTRADVGDTWSCAKARWNGEIEVVQFTDRIMVYTADGYPMIAVRDSGVTVHCSTTTATPTWYDTWETTSAPLSCWAEGLAGPVYVAERLEDGDDWIVLSQAGLGIVRIARDRTSIERSEDGCPPPPPRRRKGVGV